MFDKFCLELITTPNDDFLSIPGFAFDLVRQLAHQQQHFFATLVIYTKRAKATHNA
jgi:hypothetical protein